MQPDPLVDRATPTVDDIRDRWVRADWWARDCGEHRVRPGQDHHVLEGLRHARADIRALLAEVDRAEQRGYDRAVARLRDEASRILDAVPHDRAPSQSRLDNHSRWSHAADYLDAHREDRGA